MRNLLSPPQEKNLFGFLGSDPLLTFDYDGTLAPIVKDAGQAELRPKTRRLLKGLCEVYVCSVLTGRARKDVLRHLKGIPFAHVIGNHGAEWSESNRDDQEIIERTARWKVELHASIGGLQGVQIEDKGLSISIHYRKARRKRVTLDRIEAALKPLRQMRVIGGKQVVNVLPVEIGGKGEAVVQLKKLYDKPSALFVGDDLNDEEVFDLPFSESVFKIRVGRSFESRADYFLEHQGDIDELLALLLKFGRLKRETTLESVSTVRSRTPRRVPSSPRARAVTT